MASHFNHLGVHYSKWFESFNKPADPLVLFYHWCMIHNKYKCIENTEFADVLPDNWNADSEYYKLEYKKHEVKFLLEIFVLNGQTLFVEIKRKLDCSNYIQYITISDFVNVDSYKNKNINLTYNNLETYYKRIQTSLNHFRINKMPRHEETKRNTPHQTLQELTLNTVNSIENLLSNSKKTADQTNKTVPKLAAESLSESKETKETNGKKKVRRRKVADLIEKIAKSKDDFNQLTKCASNNELIAKIKQEKEEYDISIESLRRRGSTSSMNSVLTNSSSASNFRTLPANKNLTSSTSCGVITTEPTKTEEITINLSSNATTSTLTVQATETTSSTSTTETVTKTTTTKQSRKRTDYYDVNPITNYFYYNVDSGSSKHVDQKLMEENDFAKECFEKYGLKPCSVNLNDCFKTDMFKGMSVSVTLTTEMKKKLNLPIGKRGSGSTGKKASCSSEVSKNKPGRKAANNSKSKGNLSRPKQSSLTKNGTTESYFSLSSKKTSVKAEKSVPTDVTKSLFFSRSTDATKSPSTTLPDQDYYNIDNVDKHPLRNLYKSTFESFFTPKVAEKRKLDEMLKDDDSPTTTVTTTTSSSSSNLPDLDLSISNTASTAIPVESVEHRQEKEIDNNNNDSNESTSLLTKIVDRMETPHKSESNTIVGNTTPTSASSSASDKENLGRQQQPERSSKRLKRDTSGSDSMTKNNPDNQTNASSPFCLVKQNSTRLTRLSSSLLSNNSTTPTSNQNNSTSGKKTPLPNSSTKPTKSNTKLSYGSEQLHILRIEDSSDSDIELVGMYKGDGSGIIENNSTLMQTYNKIKKEIVGEN